MSREGRKKTKGRLLTFHKPGRLPGLAKKTSDGTRSRRSSSRCRPHRFFYSTLLFLSSLFRFWEQDDLLKALGRFFGRV